jgi:DNA-binding CsgD family transcriptional regulator
VIVEREGELGTLTDAVATAAAADGTAVAVVGPAGIGKTALLEQAVLACGDVGMRVLSARPTPLERELGFGVARELLSSQVLDAEPASREARLADGGEQALPALGASALDAPPPEDPLSTALNGLHRLCLNLADEGPLALVVDDAQWADDPSLRFLAYLARRLGGRPILLVVGARTGELGGRDDPIEELLGYEAVTVLQPAPLSSSAVKTLVERRFPSAEPEFVEACGRASGANPFYLGELLRAAQEEDLAPSAGSASRVDELSTEELQRAVLGRIEALGEEARVLADAMAIFPAAAELRHLAAVGGLESESAVRAADALRAAGVLAEGRELEFRHPIIRSAVHDRVSVARGAALHRAAASVLMRDHGAAEQVVFHLLHSEPASDPASARVLSQAARAAIAAGAFHEAIAYTNRALAEPPSEDERALALRDLGLAEGHLGLPEAIDRLRAAADIAPTARSRAEILRQLGWALLTAGRFVGVEQVLDEAISGLGDEDRDLALEIEADLIAAAQMAMLPAELIAARLESRSTPPAGQTHGERCLLAVMAFEAVRQNERATAAIELGLNALPPGAAPVDLSTALPLFLGALALIYSEAFDEAHRIAFREVPDSPSPRMVAVYGTLKANVAIALGDLDGTIEACEEILASEGLHSATTAPVAKTVIAEAHVAAGRVDAAAASLDSLGLMDAPPAEVPFEQPLYARAQVRMEQGRAADALADFQACGQKLADRRSFGPAVMAWRSGAAMACAALGQHEEARRWAEEELTMARRFGAPRTLGIALRVAGQVAAPADQLPLLEEAAATLASSPARLERAKALVQLGAGLRRHGSRKAARVPLADGIELAREVGAVGVVEHAHEELIAAGGRPRRLALNGVEALTPGERRVIRLAADGRSNREIAQELVVTTKTVEMHLRNAYGKLEIASRKEIDDELREQLRKA